MLKVNNKKHQNNVIDVFLVYVLLTLNNITSFLVFLLLKLNKQMLAGDVNLVSLLLTLNMFYSFS